MRQVLEGVEQQWEIIEAENGNEAVSKALETKPDLIILDCVMPRMDGLTAARKIAQFLPDVPILMHTLYSSPRIGQEADKVGVRKTVAKSDSRVLISAVEELLHSKPPKSTRIPAEPASSGTVTAMRRTEDKIRESWAQLFATQDDNGHANILVELQDALHQHIEQLRVRVAKYPAVVERRSRKWTPPEVTPALRKAAKGHPGHQTESNTHIESNTQLNGGAARTGPDNKKANPDSL